MNDDIARLLDSMIADPRHGWSIGTFGAIGEFARDEDEPAYFVQDGDTRSIVTPRGGMRVAPVAGLTAVAYDTLSSDGETWGQAVALCLSAPEEMDQQGIVALGADADAIRAEDRGAQLFDLGVGRGHVRFAIRTGDAALIDVLLEAEGQGPFTQKVMTEVLRAQPHRVMLSAVGRIEVYSPIPGPDGSSPEGPHTHLLPKMLASGRTHAANAPIPEGSQPVLMLHPRSPWRDGLGKRVSFDGELDDLFHDVLARFGLAQDMSVRAAVEAAVEAGLAPEAYPWPKSRRGRAEARITLRRLARARAPNVTAWQQRYDRLPEPDDEAALHA